MKATERWVNAYVGNLECVKCRNKKNLGLYHTNGAAVDLDDYTEEQIRASITSFEVWCDTCTPTTTLKSKTEGRKRHKEEAKYLADLHILSSRSGGNDIYDYGQRQVTRRSLVQRLVEYHKCASCGENSSEIVSFAKSNEHTKGRRMSNVVNFAGCSFGEFMKELDKSSALCYSCYQQQNFDRKQLSTVAMDTDFWAFYDSKEQF